MDPRQNKFSKNNPDFAAGYINYFVINGAVIAPEFGDETADTKAFDLLSELYPDRRWCSSISTQSAPVVVAFTV